MMEIKEYFNKVAYITVMDIAGKYTKVYKSIYDNSYITHVGMEREQKFLADKEITDCLTHGVGYSPKDKLWYGWSHRAIFGFKVGSTCKKGDCHYKAANIEDELEAAEAFWADENNIDFRAELLKDNQIYVSWIEKETGRAAGVYWTYDKNFGRGEWVAETMDDAQQMAKDFCEGVS